MIKTFLSSFLLISLVAVLGAGCAGTSSKKSTEQVLRDAGFRAVKAVTDEQKQQLHSVPGGRLSSVQRNGKTYYVYPDRAHDTMYVGGETEYKSYQVLAPMYQEMVSMGQAFKATEYDGHWPGWDELWGNY